MTSVGINRSTGKVLSGWKHVVQSLSVLFVTRIGDRIMRRLYGSAVPGLLGKNLTPRILSNFRMAIAIAIELWEPRFRVLYIMLPSATNSPMGLRQGKLGIKLIGEYRPRALEGDFTVEGPERSVNL